MLDWTVEHNGVGLCQKMFSFTCSSLWSFSMHSGHEMRVCRDVVLT